MSDKIWSTREQIYAAKSVLPIEYPPAATYDGPSVEQIREEAVREYQEEHAQQAEDATEYLIAEIARIGAATPRSERVRSVLEDALKDAIHNDDAKKKRSRSARRISG